MKPFFFLIIISYSGVLFAQPAFRFSYDDSGNRIKREVIDLSELPNEEPGEPELMTQIDNTEIDDEISPESQQSTDQVSAPGISVFPNPVQDQVSVHIPDLTAEDDGQLLVFGINGDYHFRTTKLQETTTIDLSGKAPGQYILRLVLNAESKEWIIIKD